MAAASQVAVYGDAGDGESRLLATFTVGELLSLRGLTGGEPYVLLITGPPDSAGHFEG
jgi:hypothetical protein